MREKKDGIPGGFSRKKIPPRARFPREKKTPGIRGEKIREFWAVSPFLDHPGFPSWSFFFWGGKKTPDPEVSWLEKAEFRNLLYLFSRRRENPGMGEEKLGKRRISAQNPPGFVFPPGVG